MVARMPRLRLPGGLYHVILRGYIVPTRAFVIRTGEKNYPNTAMLSSTAAG
jgi:hypothetical protein